MDDLLKDFLTEASENIAKVDDELVRLEKNPNDPALISSIFRLVHTIKGTCGFLGLGRLEKVAHAGENVLGKIRDKELIATPEIVSVVLKAIDRIKMILGLLEVTGGEGVGDDAPLIDALNAACSGDHAAGGDDGVATTPETAAMDAPAMEPAAEHIAAGPPDGNISGQTIRVRVDLLEHLMTTVSELVLTRNQLLQLLRQQHDSGFAAPLQRLNQVVSELQDGVMKARMQPIGGAWGKLPRLIRDLAHDLGKKINLEMRGAETELDRQVMELIRDPLTHMVRNCADHGLETPAERQEAGKPETGNIILSACHQGGHIIIDIGDDGRGLNAERIRKKVLANGLATESELHQMADAQLYQYIFRPGFSTAETITAVSGRGVGMDVVRTNIEKIGGTVDLRSTPGKGSTFRIKIPLTLAIVSALIVEAGGERYALPQLSVAELVRANETSTESQRIDRLGSAPVLMLRNRLLPLIDLAEILQLPRTPYKPEDDRIVVITQVEGQTFGLVVDRVFDTEEIVVKPVAPLLRHNALFSGNTILGDGSVIMILDPKGVAVLSSAQQPDMPEAQASSIELDAVADVRDMLLIAKAGETPIAVRLSDIARLEECNPSHVEIAQGCMTMQYRGQLMPLLQLGSFSASAQPILVFADNGRSVGLIVDEIVDIVEQTVEIQWRGNRPGILGTAIVAGRAVDFLDVSYHTAPLFETLTGSPVGRAA